MTKILSGLLSILLSISVSLTLNADIKEATNKKSETKEVDHSGELYISSEHQMQDIDQTLAKAKDTNKLALIVMGANWCHDSRALATKLFLPEVKGIIDSNYELLFVDVGYLSKVKNVITRFGMPVIYATPTVLIVDPSTEQPINGHNMHIWRDADKVEVVDTAKYFSDIAQNKQQFLASLSPHKDADMAKLNELNQSIDEFEQRNAERIYKAFAVIGPLMKEKKEGGEAKNLMKYWKPVAAYRYKITDDLALLREQALQIARAPSSDKKLVFPEYPAFEWEKS